MLFGYPVINGTNYERLNAYFTGAAHELDTASDVHATIMYIGDPDLCGDIHSGMRNAKLRRADARDSATYRRHLTVPGWQDWHRLGEMAEYRRILGLRDEDVPGIVWMSRAGTRPLGVLRIPLIESLAAADAFDRRFRVRITRDDFKALALTALPDSRLVVRFSPFLDDMHREIDSAVRASRFALLRPRKRVDPSANTLVILTKTREAFFRNHPLDARGAQYRLLLELARQPQALIPHADLVRNAAKRGHELEGNNTKWAQDNKWLLMRSFRKLADAHGLRRVDVDSLIAAKKGCLILNLTEEEITLDE